MRCVGFLLYVEMCFSPLALLNMANEDFETCEDKLNFVIDEAAPAVETAPAAPLGEAMDLMTALQVVLRKSLAHGGLARGLHEGAKVIEKHAAQLCVLAEDCNQPDYVKLVKALCADHNVSLLTVPSAKTLGEWAGVSI